MKRSSVVQNVEQLLVSASFLKKKKGIRSMFLIVIARMAGYGNDYLPWLYTQPLQPIGGANVCIVLGK
jgi:hypothetical protein